MKNLLPERLRELRGSLSQSEFASKIGVKQTSYSSWERGVKDPASQTLVLIASTFGVSADWLLGLHEIQSNTPECDTCATKLISNSCDSCKYKKLADAFKAIQ